jgi:D-alanine transaminase
MSRTAYVNGQYLAHNEAAVHIEDRGYQFADGVYEVFAVVEGTLIDADAHFDRLERSLGEIRMELPMTRRAFGLVMAEVLRRNRVNTGILYLQVTRGSARRDHGFPSVVQPSVVMTARPMPLNMPDSRREKGIAVITVPDTRWGRCDIKSVALLPNVLAKQQARDGGAYEAWFVGADGFVTEGSSTNAWIVDADGNLVTRAADNGILNGVTRQALLRIAARAGIAVVERPFTVDEAKAAREAFISSSSGFVLPVVAIDGQPVANGVPGSVARRLGKLYQRYAGKGL